MEDEYRIVDEHVDYGLEKIDPEHKIEDSFRDYLYFHNVVEEFVRFFH